MRDLLRRSELLRSSNGKTRSTGLADLKQIFTVNSGRPALNGLNDKAYHSIYDEIFRLVSSEKSKANTATATRLAAAAQVLRLAVQPAVRKLKIKTVSALLDHISQTLPLTSGGLYEALSVDYLKCLQSVLDYQPHVEHLSPERWRDLVDFCIESLDAAIVGPANASHTRSNDTSGTRLSDRSINASSRSGTTEPVARTRGQASSNSLILDLVECLHQLVRAPNAPLLDRARPLLRIVVGFLQSTSSAGRAHQAAFTIINTIVARSSLEVADLTEQALDELLPLIKRFWSPKNISLNNEMLILLVHTKHHIARLLKATVEAQAADRVEAVTDCIFVEYSQRPDRSLLQLDALALGDAVGNAPLRNRHFHVRPRNPRAESQWVAVHLVAYFSSLLDVFRHPLDDEGQDAEASPNAKRVRVAQRWSDFLRRILHPDLSAKIAALQVITFLIEEVQLERSDIQELQERLIPLIPDDNGAVASWAMLALARLVSHDL
jgi:serine-protein kinase ATM